MPISPCAWATMRATRTIRSTNTPNTSGNKDPVDRAGAYKEFAPGKNVHALLDLPDQWFGGIRHPTLQEEGIGALLIIFREFLRRQLGAEGLYGR
jgi:hypothetical protein